MELFVKMDELSEEGTKLRKIAKENIDVKINELILLANELEWQSPSFNSFLVQYVESATKLYGISEIVDRIGEFLENASSEWTDTGDQASKKIQSFSSEVETLVAKVNKIKESLK